MSIYITGDTHGNLDIRKLNSRSFKEGKKLTKNDYVIVLGDFGVLWTGTSKDNYMIKWWNDKPWTTLFIDGNHENHALLNSYPVEEWNGGKIHKITDSIIHLMRGQVFELEGKKLFCMGGAKSVDRMYRTEGISWWSEEMPSLEEMQAAVDNLEKYNWEVDYVLTHSVATDIVRYYGYEGDELTNFFMHLEFDFGLKFKKWYSGHYHHDEMVDEKHYFVYDKIVKLD